jgi:hypothetical protein
MRSKGTVKERKKAGTAPVEVDGCRHHWVIETPRGALSNGRCKLCGEEREFRNSANDYIWDDDSSSRSGYGRWSTVRSSPKGPATDDGDMTAASGSGKGGTALAV